jgi:Protein of unknown function (DUF1222).
MSHNKNISMSSKTLSSRCRLLSGLGLIFLIAFVSYHVQFPGLVSSAGIEPAGRIFPHVFPRLYDKLIENDSQSSSSSTRTTSFLWVKVDLLCETCCILGIVLSSIVACGILHHGGLIMIMTLLYYILVQLGGVFYSFQWDTLLLETGFVVSLCYAPWCCCWPRSSSCRSSSSSSARSSSSISEQQEVGRWPIRFLLFKLMFMSGVVKIQSDCPTWTNLTALEYHFATQCLPGPLAWYAHQMHPLLLRLGVAMTLWIEIPGAFLLISWKSTFRKFGAWMQIALQIMIVLSGNYNFFNALTVLLCLACLEEEGKEEEDDDDNDDDDGAGRGVEKVVVPSPKKEKIKRKRCRGRYDLHLCFAYLAWTFSNMFEIHNVPVILAKKISQQQTMTMGKI